MSATAEKTKVPKRSELETKDTWDLEAVYPAAEDWEKDFARLDGLLEPVLAFKGKLSSPGAVADLFRAEDELDQLLEKLYTYAHHREDEDTSNPEGQARQQRVVAKYAQIAGQCAWISPEILSQDLETLEQWRDSEALRDYRRSMTVLIRRKPHTLSDSEETLLSRAAEIFRVPSSAFNYLTNADLKFEDVEDEKGQPQPLTNGRYVLFLENRNRDVRRKAFEELYDKYIQFQNTLASTLSGAVKLHNYNAQIRHHPSALAASLHPDNIPVELYTTLIEATHEALPGFYEYVDLRKALLGVDDLNMYDMYVPVVPEYEVKVPWDEACEWVREACLPLGEEYADGLAQAFGQRWIDVYENEGKRSGAYSGGCYGTYPYVLMNYQGTLDWVFTLAHELGHSLHSWLAIKNQPYRYADYTIFVAEIASTTNEALLHHYLLQKADDPRFKAYLLNHLCDAFKGTVFRQTMFAEYEKMIHEMDAEGRPLTAQALSETYYELNKRYYGPQVEAEKRIANEWSRIPHFYYNFYVYKYATGFCAAQVFAKRILEGGAARDAYLDMLRSGGSDDPLELVRKGGVDLTDRATLTSAFDTFRQTVRDLRGLLVKE